MGIQRPDGVEGRNAYADKSRDAFDNDLARITRNNADLGSHYRATPERWRLFRNDERVLYQYEEPGALDFFADRRTNDRDVYVLSPDAGDTVTLRTAERFRYTVNFVSQVSKALAVSLTA